MKKYIAIVLSFLMALTLCACGPAADAGSTGTDSTGDTGNTSAQAAFSVGFGEANIVPDWPIGLSGFGNESTRISTGFNTYIYAHVIAVTDESGNTALMVATDLAATDLRLAAGVRTWCEETLGIPQANVLISAGHQHSAPIPTEDYVEFCIAKVKTAIQDALDDRAPAEMFINTVQTEALSFVRNYRTNAGTIWGPNYGDDSSGLKSHESESDKDMQLLKFKRGEDKKDIIVVNFQAHPHAGTSSSDTNISADWPGIMREEVKAELGCNVMYFSGAGGNLNSGSSIASENISKDWKDHGHRAAQYVLSAEDSYTKVNGGPVKAKEVTFTYEADHSMDHLLEIATIVNDIRQSEGIAAGRAAAARYPELHSVYHATAIVSKAGREATTDLTISAISIGDVAFTVHPYEMFDTNGMELKAGTVGNENYTAEEQMKNPYAMTIITTMSNGSNGYVPSKLGYTNGGYSTDITRFAPGSGERMVGDYLEILNELHG